MGKKNFWIMFGLLILPILICAIFLLSEIFNSINSLKINDWLQYSGAVLGYLGTVIVSIVALSQNYRLLRLEEKRDCATIIITVSDDNVEVDSDNCDTWFSVDSLYPEGYNFFCFDTYKNGEKVLKKHSCIIWFKFKNISMNPISKIGIENFCLTTYGSEKKDHFYKDGYSNFIDIIEHDEEKEFFIYFESDYTDDGYQGSEDAFIEEYFELSFNCILETINGIKSIQPIKTIMNTTSRKVNDTIDYGGRKNIVIHKNPK